VRPTASAEDATALSARYTGALAVLALIGTCVLAHTNLHGPVCLFRTAFGIPCPGCGLTRSFESLWRGEYVIAFRYHPLGPPAFAALILIAGWSAAYAMAPRWRPWLIRVARPLGRPAAAWGALCMLLTVWAVRLADAMLHGGLFLW